jgi:alkylated DNA repair dioxygenase AlkB
MAMAQLPLFGRAEVPSVDAELSALERIQLDHGAWLDVARGWLRGEAEIFAQLRAEVAWRSERRVMYEKEVDVPRQIALADDGARLHPVFAQMRRALDRRYATQFTRLGFALYRDGRDSVAWHGDYVARRLQEAVVATISVGAPRRFLLRPMAGGPSLALNLGWGDLVVMGGTCQRTYRHSIPKVAHAEPRIAIMFRPQWQDADADSAANDGERE